MYKRVVLPLQTLPVHDANGGKRKCEVASQMTLQHTHNNKFEGYLDRMLTPTKPIQSDGISV
jgi:hypothetical protein